MEERSMFLFHRNLFWKINQITVLFLWIILLYSSLESQSLFANTLLVLFLLSHLIQAIFLSSKNSGYTEFTYSQTAILIILFGYSWWVPFVINKNP